MKSGAGISMEVSGLVVPANPPLSLAKGILNRASACAHVLHGAPVRRCETCFAGPPEEVPARSCTGIQGVFPRRTRLRRWATATRSCSAGTSPAPAVRDVWHERFRRALCWLLLLALPRPAWHNPVHRNLTANDRWALPVPDRCRWSFFRRRTDVDIHTLAEKVDKCV